MKNKKASANNLIHNKGACETKRKKISTNDKIHILKYLNWKIDILLDT